MRTGVSIMKKGFTDRVQPVLLIAKLALICSPHAVFAMESLSDEELSNSNAGALGLLPENFSFQLNGADGTPGTGYARLIPVGPNPYQTITSASGVDGELSGSLGTFYKKADAYLYGLALSQSQKSLGEQRDITSTQSGGGAVADNDLYERYARPIDSFGSADNPFVIGVRGKPVVTYAGVEQNSAQLFIEAPKFDSSVYDPASGASAAEQSAYNLKLGLWTDLFSIDDSQIENGTDGLLERLRLNVVWDGLSINGSHLSLFQTAGNSTNPDYNQTMGISGLIRINSGDGAAVRAQVVDNTSPLFTISTYGGTDLDDPSNNEGRYLINTTQEGAKLRQGTTSWTPQFSSVLSVGTAEMSSNDLTTLNTPALGGAAPNFDPTEGLKLYNVNVNFPLAQSYQPLIVGSADDASNLKVELARIPDVDLVYRRKYQRYALNPYEQMTGLGSAGSGDTGSQAYFGSTCNFYKCEGLASFLPATHGSITIGSTQYDPVTNLLRADASQEAIGVSFGSLANTQRTYGNTLADARVENFVYRRRTRTDEVANSGADLVAPEGDWYYYSQNNLILAPEANEGNWAQNNSISSESAYGQGFGSIPKDSYTPSGNRSLYSVPFNSNLAKTSYIGADNNLGSVAIDGINIHHIEFETAGLN